MPEQPSTILNKVWSMCDVLRDEGVSYGDYLEQLTYMIFLKMADEYARPPYNRSLGIPAGNSWADLRALSGAALPMVLLARPLEGHMYTFQVKYKF